MNILAIFILLLTMAHRVVDINPAIYNDAYRPYLNDTTQTQIFFGGSSSGKSYFAIGQRMIIDLMKGERNYLAVRNVGKTLKTSIYNEAVKSISRMGVQELFTINKTDMTITCRNGYQAILKGLDDVEKIKSITPEKGVLTDILIEEATETKRDDVRQLVRRLRGRSDVKKRLTMLFNPVYRSHWIYQDYFTGHWGDSDTFYKDEELLILKTTYSDNLKHLESGDVAVLENETNKYWYDVFTLGNWGVLGELVFTNWRVESLQGHMFDTFYNGLDFGYSNDPTAVTRSSVRGKTLYVLDVPIYEKGLTNDVIADRLKPIIHDDVIRCDSAEPKSIAELKDRGIMAIGARKGPGSVNYGIQYLQQFEIIVDPKCQQLINELQLYQWDKDKDGNVINTPVDKYNHAIDSLRYAHDGRMTWGESWQPMSKNQAGLF